MPFFEWKLFFLNNDLKVAGDLLVYGFFRGVPVSNVIIVSTSIWYMCFDFQLWAKSPWLNNVQINVKMMASSPLKL